MRICETVKSIDWHEIMFLLRNSLSVSIVCWLRIRMSAFSELGVMPEIVQAIEEMDWLLPTDVQAEAIPLILGGGDVLMAAETGSGKTGAFCLPILQIVQETLINRLEGKSSHAPQKCLLNYWDRDEQMAISRDGLTCQSRDKNWQGCRSTWGVVEEDRYYYEATVSDEGLCRIGWSILEGRLELGKDDMGYGFGGTSKKSFNSQFDDYGEKFGKNDTIGCFLDLSSREISYAKNGKDLGLAFKIDKDLMGKPFFAACTIKNAELIFNFGEKPFTHDPTEGYKALSKSKHVSSQFTEFSQTRDDKKTKQRSPIALILEPSRELAHQTIDQVMLFKRHITHPEVRELATVGGDSAKMQIEKLSQGVDLVCGTPGRLDDLICTRVLSLEQIKFLVLDEADGLLSQGHGEVIDKIHQMIPRIHPDGERLQMIVCSATLHNFEVKKLAQRLMYFPTWVDLKGQDSVPETVHHVVCRVDPRKDTSWHGMKSQIRTDGVHQHDDTQAGGTQQAEAYSEAVKLIKGDLVIRAIKQHKMDQGIIFCRTKLDCDNLERYLKFRGTKVEKDMSLFTCVCLHSDRRPAERKQNLQLFKNAEVRFLICTDVAARGIDLKGVPYVINCTMPDDKMNYVHRIGRVGRAEKMGLAISFASCVPEKVWYHSCPSRGKDCRNTNLKEEGGCCIWYDEQQYLGDIEEHLGETIPEVDRSLSVPENQFDGKVFYGQKRDTSGSCYKGHVDQVLPSLQKLTQLEKDAQRAFLSMDYSTRI